MDEDVKFVLGRLDGKVDALLAQLTDHQGTLKSIELRVRTLEQWRWMVAGAAGAVGALTSYLMKWLSH